MIFKTALSVATELEFRIPATVATIPDLPAMPLLACNNPPVDRVSSRWGEDVNVNRNYATNGLNLADTREHSNHKKLHRQIVLVIIN